MANNNYHFVDDMQLNTTNSFTYLLDTEKTDELNVIRHSPYTSADELIESRLSSKNGPSLLTNSQITTALSRLSVCKSRGFHLKPTYPYMIPGYHLISTGHYTSTHGGLVIYLNKK